MKHLEAAFTGRNAPWRYIVMIVAVFLAANSIGAIPLIIGFAVKTVSDPDMMTRLASNPNNLNLMGFDSNLTFFMMLFPFLAAIVTFWFLIKPLNNRTLPQTVNGTSVIRWNRILISGLIWIVFSAIYLIVYKGFDPSSFKLNNTSFSLFYLIIISFLFVPFQASLEEVVFRGYLMQGFAVMFRNRWLPVLLTSLLFGVMHSWNPEIKQYGFFTMMPQYVLFGLLFGIITILDDGIEIAAGAHAGNNIFLSIMVTNRSTILQTPAVYEQINIKPWVEFWALAISALLFFVVMKRIFGWNNSGVLLDKVKPSQEAYQMP